MERVKLKIKRLETTDSNLEAYAKRKSGIVIQEALFKEEKQKARVKELELRLKKLEAGWKGEKDLKNWSNDLAVKIEAKNLEGELSSNNEEVVSLHTTSADLETLHSEHDALHKERAALLKKLVKKKNKVDGLLNFGDYVTKKETKKLTAEIDVERAKVKMLEQNRKEIEKGVYLTIKEGLSKKLASDIDVERTKVKQLEQNSKEIEKGASLTLKEGLSDNLASDIDVERAEVKQVEQNRKEVKKRASRTSKKSLRKKLASNVDVELAKAKQLEQNRKEIVHNFVDPGKDRVANDVGQISALSGLPMSMEEATPFNMVKDDKNATIQFGEMIVPLFPKPTLLAAQVEKPAAKP